MKIVRIFAVVEDSLYSVRYDEEAYEAEDEHEFRRLFRDWNDAEYLEQFFVEHQDDLESEFWGGISVHRAILKTRKDAKSLERKLVQIAETGKTDRHETLSTLFKPLFDEPDHLDPYEKDKAYGIDSPSWLRIYAIRLDANVFVVSGGAIKLTKDMNRPHLQQELRKLDIAQAFCKENPDLTLGYFEIE